MKILLLNSPWVQTKTQYGVKAGSRWANIRNLKQNIMHYPFPFTLAYACSFLKSKGYEAVIKDAIAEGLSLDETMEFATQFRPEVVVLETCTPSIDTDLKFAERLKEAFSTTIILSGNHATAVPEQVLQNKAADFVILGNEFEFVLLELLEHPDNYKEIKGIAFRENGEIRVNERRELIKDLDILPYPERDSLPLHKYNDPFCKDYPNLPIISSRGCPFTCIFCLEPYVFYERSSLRTRSAKCVVDEMVCLVDKYQMKEPYFDDASFTNSMKSAREISQEILRRGLKMQWSCMGDPRADYETLKIMKEAGCVGLKFGVESADPQIRKTIQKPTTLEQVKNFVNACNRLGLYSHGTYMLGLPGETKESMYKTIDFAFSLNSTTCQFSIATPLPGTKYYEMAEKNDWLMTKDWSKYEGAGSSIIRVPGLTAEEILAAMKTVKKKRILQTLKRPRIGFNYLWKLYKMRGFVGTLEEIFQKTWFLLTG
ncbi:MAG: radical SAM protein [Candidatus Omnitrophica bacterium]|nr:radical SAM protein [Candidatus Omnitrophota bacterium]